MANTRAVNCCVLCCTEGGLDVQGLNLRGVTDNSLRVAWVAERIGSCPVTPQVQSSIAHASLFHW